MQFNLKYMKVARTENVTDEIIVHRMWCKISIVFFK